MNSRAMRALTGEDRPAVPVDVARAGDAASLLLDSAISHCEKLRRVLQLEEWINATPDNSIFGQTRRKWQEQRDRLVSELRLERLDAASAGDAGNSEPTAGTPSAVDTNSIAPGH